MKQADKEKIKSALRHFVLTAAAVWIAKPDSDWKAVLAGALAAIVGPAIRAVDKNDPAFGKVANRAEIEINKLAKRSKKK